MEKSRNIVNKSDVVLDMSDLKLLSLGLNFVPTPNWNGSIERKEWNNLFQHVRKTEWQDIFKEDLESNYKSTASIEKLKVRKFSRPNNKLISEDLKK